MTTIKEEILENPINISKFNNKLVLPLRGFPTKSIANPPCWGRGLGIVVSWSSHVNLNLLIFIGFSNISSVLEMIKDSGDKVLLILDDCISDIRGKGKSEIENLLHRIFFNRRHLAGKGGSLSIIATSQTSY